MHFSLKNKFLKSGHIWKPVMSGFQMVLGQMTDQTIQNLDICDIILGIMGPVSGRFQSDFWMALKNQTVWQPDWFQLFKN